MTCHMHSVRVHRCARQSLTRASLGGHYARVFALPAFSLCGEVGDGDGLGVVNEEGGGAKVVDFAIES